MRSQATDLRVEIDEYDRLRSGKESTFEASSIEELATLLIKARIARGWSKRDLAEAHVVNGHPRPAILGIAAERLDRCWLAVCKFAQADIAKALAPSAFDLPQHGSQARFTRARWPRVWPDWRCRPARAEIGAL